MQVVYVDVLIILNTYINFALLRLAALISKAEVKKARLLLSALLGGVYSLIILVDDIPNYLSFVFKCIAGALMVAVAYKFRNAASYIKTLCSFLFVTFLFAGLMFTLWIFVKPETMLYKNTTVYFGFDTMTLLVATTVCYVILRCLYFVVEQKAPKGHIYEVTIYLDGNTISCKALLDSGNSLRDYFTSLPVIAVDRSLFDFISDDISSVSPKLKPRYIPINTVSGDGLMLTVRPDKVRIKGIGCDFETKEILVGLTNSKIKNGDFEAVLPYEAVMMREGKSHA